MFEIIINKDEKLITIESIVKRQELEDLELFPYLTICLSEYFSGYTLLSHQTVGIPEAIQMNRYFENVKITSINAFGPSINEQDVLDGKITLNDILNETIKFHETYEEDSFYIDDQKIFHYKGATITSLNIAGIVPSLNSEKVLSLKRNNSLTSS